METNTPQLLIRPSLWNTSLWNMGCTSLLIALWGSGMFQDFGSFFIVFLSPLWCIPLLCSVHFKTTWRRWTQQEKGEKTQSPSPFETLRKAYLCMVLLKIVVPFVGIILFVREKHLEKKGVLIGLPLYEHYYVDPYNVKPIY